MAAKHPAIRRRLRTVILVTCASALLFMAIILFAYQYFVLRQAALRNLQTLGEAIATNSTAALAFDNVEDAKGILSALKADPQIVAAALYDKKGKLFAKFPDTLSDRNLPEVVEDDSYRVTSGDLIGFQRIAERNEVRLGTLYLRSTLRSVYAAVGLYALIIAVVILMSLPAAYMISTRLQRQITQPILALAETAAAISERRDYSVRATKENDDEFGRLTDAFNHMLARIQGQLGNLDLLQKITRAIADRLDMPSIFKAVLGRLEDSMPIDFGCICLYDAPTEVLSIASIGPRSTEIASNLALSERTHLPIEKSGLGKCIRGSLVYEPNMGAVFLQFPTLLTRGGLRSAVFAPLLVESTIFGVLIAARREPDSFSSSDCEFLKQLSEHVALAAHQTQLHGALQQAYDDLRQTQNTVMQQERLRALGQMASGIAHDINNAISPVSLYTESLLEHEPNLSDRARSYLGTIHQAIDDVANTVARMREFYRHREPQLVLAAVDLNHLTSQVIDMTRARWSAQPQESGIVIELRTQFSSDLPTVMGAEGEIRDALTNLIFNAVDAMPEGGTLTLRTQLIAKRDHPGDELPAMFVAIEVSDTGVGMDGETKQRCLEPFYTTKGERGTGLGLAMVYGMVQRHSAALELDSEVGKGTTVRMIFPVSTPIFSATTRLPAPSVQTRRLRILIVDDDPLLIKSLRDILELDGHVVAAADGGQKGIDAFFTAQKNGTPFSIVITDLGMPYVDGIRVAAAIKQRSPATPIVMLTGWGQRLLEEKDLPPNVDRVLSKPPRIHELRNTIAEVDAEFG